SLHDHDLLQVVGGGEAKTLDAVADFDGPALLHQQFAADEARGAAALGVVAPEALDLLLFAHHDVGARALAGDAGEGFESLIRFGLDEGGVADECDAEEPARLVAAAVEGAAVEGTD